MNVGRIMLGEDTVLVNNTSVRGSMNINTGSEDDTVRIGRGDGPQDEGETDERVEALLDRIGKYTSVDI